jgi:DNA-binding Lrp family transcriptional regulator
MKNQISDIERRILAVLQGGFPRSQSPYKDIAESVGIDTKQLLTILENWKRDGKLRRIGAIVDYFKVGLSGGAMVAWRVEPEHIEQVGTKLAEFKEVSHAYERKTAENWPYNIYTMVHGTDIQEVKQIVNRMSRACGVSDYRILATQKELKKTPPTYVTELSAGNTRKEED